MRINDDLLINPKVNGSVYADAFKSKNLFNKNEIINNVELNGTTGGTISNNSMYISNYMEVEPDTDYYITKPGGYGSSNCLYDKNKNFIETISKQQGKITIPNNSAIKYLRFNGYKTEIDGVQFEKGSTQTTYMPYQSYGVEYGSNSYGSYTKFADGTLICYIRKSVNATVSTQWGNLYTAVIDSMTFPYSFISAPVITISIIGNSSSAFIMNWTSPSNSLTQTGQLAIVRGNTKEASDYIVNVIAIGRWK